MLNNNGFPLKDRILSDLEMILDAFGSKQFD